MTQRGSASFTVVIPKGIMDSPGCRWMPGWKGQMDMAQLNALHGKIYDISILLGAEQIDAPIPGVKPFSLEAVFSIDKGDPCNLSNLSMNCHTGTHLDVPSHFVGNSKTIDDYPVESFILPAQVVEIQDSEVINKTELENLPLEAGDAVLFKTANSGRGICRDPGLAESWVYLSPEAAAYCVSKKVSLVGIDYMAPEKPGGTLEDAPIHDALLGNDIFILEGIALDNVPPGRYTLLCLPLKLKGAEASPVRAVLIG